MKLAKLFLKHFLFVPHLITIKQILFMARMKTSHDDKPVHGHPPGVRKGIDQCSRGSLRPPVCNHENTVSGEQVGKKFGNVLLFVPAVGVDGDLLQNFKSDFF